MIYYDNAATSQICPAAKEALLESLEPEFFGNPSAPHAHGLTAERRLKTARQALASAANCKPEELVFTSGGTESNNLAILGAAKVLKSVAKKTTPHIFATDQEHPSVTEPLLYLAENGFKVTFAAPDSWELCEDAAMLCLPAAASETGILFQPVTECNRLPPSPTSETGAAYNIEEIAARARAANPNILIFVDGAQSFAKLAKPPACANLYSFSGHKFHAPKGVGGLIVRGTRLQPIFFGGGQQPYRSGTENTAGIAAMAAAADFAANPAHLKTVTEVKGIISSLSQELPDAHINTFGGTSPYILNMSFPGINGETLVNLLSSKKLYAGVGSACNTKNSKKPLLHILGEERANSAVRFSFSAFNTVEEAHTAKGLILESVRALRRTKK